MTRVKVTCTDPDTGESETQELDPDSYIVVCGANMHVSYEQVSPKSGTVQLTLKRAPRIRASDRGATGHAVDPAELRDGFGGIA